VGGQACVYCPVADVEQWSTAVREVLQDRAAPALPIRLARATRFSWDEHARTVLDAYLRLLP
jgi:glycosyltransferase involved in cell wall biosynthesis